MVIHSLSVATLVPYSRILRKNDPVVAQMVASIQQFGFKIPILALSDGVVIDGHLRLKAAQKLGMKEVPVILCDEWSEEQVKAFRLMVNRSASWAEWDIEAVTLELGELKAIDFDLRLIGFTPVEIDEMLFGDDKKEHDDVVPEVPAGAVTWRGDLWICGPHRVLCGDATSPEEVSALFGSLQPVLMVTDPPYGVEYDPKWREQAGLGRARQSGSVPNDDRVDWTAAYRLFTGDIAYVWHAGLHASEVARGLEEADFRIRSQIIWAKQHFALSRGDYHWQHEPCWYAVRGGQTSNWNGDRTQSTLWQVANLNPIGGTRDEVATGHGTQKPVELMRRPILNHTKRGDVIYDPFLGSGTTLVAAELTERLCCGLDIDPGYVDVIVKRWQQITGKSAILEAAGRSFDLIADERSAAKAEA